LNRPGKNRESIGDDIQSGLAELESYGQMILANQAYFLLSPSNDIALVLRGDGITDSSLAPLLKLFPVTHTYTHSMSHSNIDESGR